MHFPTNGSRLGGGIAASGEHKKQIKFDCSFIILYHATLGRYVISYDRTLLGNLAQETDRAQKQIQLIIYSYSCYKCPSISCRFDYGLVVGYVRMINAISEWFLRFHMPSLSLCNEGTVNGAEGE